MTTLPPDFKDFLRLLASHEVPYLLVGGHAVGYHGYPRATGDMDIWVARDEDTARKLVAVLRDFGFDTDEVTPDLFLGEKAIIRMGVPPVRIDITNFIHGVEFAACHPSRVRASIDEVDVHVIGLADLKANKRASGRPKDQDDLQNLP